LAARRAFSASSLRATCSFNRSPNWVWLLCHWASCSSLEMTEKKLGDSGHLGRHSLTDASSVLPFPYNSSAILDFWKGSHFSLSVWATVHTARCGSVFGACSFAPFPPKSRACVQYQYLDRSMRHASNVCAPDFAAISLSSPVGPARRDH
jgi:hypothetical protein